MITEEKLQDFLDDLRLGKYDNERYEIDVAKDTFTIKDLQNNTELHIVVYEDCPQYWDDYRKWCHRNRLLRYFYKEPVYENYPIEYKASITYFKDGGCTISKTLYESFITYCKEIIERDRLVESSNIEASFGL